MESVKVGSVFTPGRAPGVTYNPRDERDVEGTIRRFMMHPGAALTVSGPTKSGKTVVVERVLPRDEAIWMNGGDLRSVDNLWSRVVDFLSLYDELGITTTSGSGGSSGISGTIGAPGVASITGQFGETSEITTTRSASVRRPLATVAREALRVVKVPLVIDDFHYVDELLKVELTRAIKGLVTDSPVVMIAVPQDAFRAVRDETDMLGRVWQLQIAPWTEKELSYIARAGFEALNVVDRGESIGEEFARNSLGAPFLMQQLCLDFCLDLGVSETLDAQFNAQLPQDLGKFYEKVATRYVPGVFEALRMGPRTKGQQRLARRLKTGEETDIYGAVLYGMARMGPRRQITTQQLARTIGEHFSEAPKTQNVASALGHMKTIAEQSRGASDAALDYKDDIVYMTDPFLSFFLRFGSWELPSPPVGTI